MQVTLQRLPDTLAQFDALPQNDLTRPENTCALFLAALRLYTLDANAGVEALNRLRGPRPMTGYDAQFIRDRLRGKAYLPTAYFEGATPQNGYAPRAPYVLNVLSDPRPQDIEPGYLRVYLKTSGADSPRPMRLRKKGENWVLWEYSSILTGIRMPAAEDPWA